MSLLARCSSCPIEEAHPAEETDAVAAEIGGRAVVTTGPTAEIAGRAVVVDHRVVEMRSQETMVRHDKKRIGTWMKRLACSRI
jgi:hypothetical protein